MGNFNRDNKRSSGGFSRGSSSGRSFSNGSKFGGRDGGRPVMHKATCNECGASCEIPFRPTGGRPVFCSDCFAKQGHDNKRSDFGGDRRDRPRFADKSMHQTVCSKCGNDCQVPFRPIGGKPVFCDNCFTKGGNERGDNKNSGEIMEQIKMLNAKIDKLIKILSPNVMVEKTIKPEMVKDTVVKKIAKEKTAKKITSKKVTAKNKK